MRYLHDLTGEIFGTFLLVLIGCSSVAVAVLYSAYAGLFQIAMIWGLAVTLAIFATRHLSCAHFNPAVTVAMAVRGRMPWRRVPLYLLGQFIGAFLAAGVLYLLFSTSIQQFESLNQIVRGTPQSIKTAQMFGEFYPNPGAGSAAAVTMFNAFLAEAIGTFVLVSMIFALTEGCNLGRPSDNAAPLFIGLTVTVLISILAPLTQAGFNPARDLAPRLFAAAAGWGTAAFPDAGLGFLTVYVLGPLVGGICAALLSYLVEPLMKSKALLQPCCRKEAAD